MVNTVAAHRKYIKIFAIITCSVGQKSKYPLKQGFVYKLYLNYGFECTVFYIILKQYQAKKFSTTAR